MWGPDRPSISATSVSNAVPNANSSNLGKRCIVAAICLNAAGTRSEFLPISGPYRLTPPLESPRPGPRSPRGRAGVDTIQQVLILTVIQGPDKGRTFELPDNEPQLVGRSSEALPITDNTVSRRHAELTPDDGEWWLNDLGSQNGTWVNGVRLAERTKLRSGDQIRTGSTLFVFGTSKGRPASGSLRMLRPPEIDTNVERTMPSNEDSVILSEPEPRQAAVEHLRVIYRLTTLMSRPMERQELLEGLMDLVFSEFRAERGCVVMLDAGEPEPVPVVIRQEETDGRDKPVRFAVSRTILTLALRKGEGVLSSNAMTDPRFAAGDSVMTMNIRSAICSPIRFRDRTFGAIYIDSSIANYTFTPEQLALMNAIGQHAGLALANAELYAQKLQSERLAAMGETVASLSHSIKNILQGLRGGGDVVEMGLRKEDLRVARGGWGILKRNLDRIMSLTLNMLAYSRPHAPEIELVQVGPLLDDCASLLADQCQARDIALIIDCEPDIPPVALDSGQMHQALMNLMTNAVEAVEAKTGVVTVKAAYFAPGRSGGDSPHAELRIEVIDNGPGIPPEKQARVFEPFFTTKGLRGTGLGLAVTKRIVEQHGGQVEIRSQTGRGAAFLITLPVELGLVIDPSRTAHPKGEPRRGAL